MKEMMFSKGGQHLSAKEITLVEGENQPVTIRASQFARLEEGNMEILIDKIHQNAKDHGWYEEKRSFAEIIALIQSELSEALEFDRQEKNLNNININHQHHYTGKFRVNSDTLRGMTLSQGPFVEIKSNNSMMNCDKPDGSLVELADAVIRIFDYIGSIDMAEEFVKILNEKHEYNVTRPHKHGGKKI